VWKPVLVKLGQGNNNVFDYGWGNFIAVGGSGSDKIQGGNGYNLLIGGDGADTLIAGGSKGTILIGGRTDFDSDPAANSLPNVAALDAIMAEWSSGDTYQDRVHKIDGQTPGGANDPFFLNGLTVHADKRHNVLNAAPGFGGMNFFLADTDGRQDTILSKKKKERLLWIYEGV
jgi:Ca2+-binding RTX toxin-like protein